MRVGGLAVLILVGVRIPMPLCGQVGQLDRGDRVVIWSPHFDEAPIEPGGFECPPAPARFFGFESPLDVGRASSLEVRVFGSERWVGEQTRIVPLPNAQVAIAPFTGSEALDRIPRSPTAGVLADQFGVAEATAAPGTYSLWVQKIGYGPGASVIRIAPGAQASVTVYLDMVRLCEE